MKFPWMSYHLRWMYLSTLVVFGNLCVGRRHSAGDNVIQDGQLLITKPCQRAAQHLMDSHSSMSTHWAFYNFFEQIFWPLLFIILEAKLHYFLVLISFRKERRLAWSLCMPHCAFDTSPNILTWLSKSHKRTMEKLMMDFLTSLKWHHKQHQQQTKHHFQNLFFGFLWKK